MKPIARLIFAALLVMVLALTWTACGSYDDGYTGSTTVYVNHGYGGYVDGRRTGWGGYGGYGGYGAYGPRW